MANKLYVRGMEINKPNNHKSYFFGKHSTGYGEFWNSVLGDANKLSSHIENCVEKGDIVFKQNLEDKIIRGLIYPEPNLINSMSLIETYEERNTFVGIYPLLMGINNNFKLKESFSWAGNVEGEMAVETDLGRIINFYNPYFLIDNKNFEVDKMQTISLAGLVLSIGKMEVQEIPMKKGDSYNHCLREFLKENPHKTEKDFEPPIHVIDPRYFRTFLPSDYCCEFEISTQIKEIRYTDFLGEKITVMKVNLEHEDENEFLYCNIYASKHVLGKYKPKVGDGINALVWLTGFFN